MAYRREDVATRTDRPNGPSSTANADDGLPTVREILALDAVASGVPEVLVGGPALDARVRWLHVSDSAGVQLANGSSGSLLLKDGSTTIAQATYGGWSSSMGASLQLKALHYAAGAQSSSWCTSTSTWSGSTDKGTPGAANDCP